MLRLREQIKGELAENVAKVARARQTIGETQLQIVNEDSRRLDEIVSQLADTRSELASIEEHAVDTPGVDMWRDPRSGRLGSGLS